MQRARCAGKSRLTAGATATGKRKRQHPGEGRQLQWQRGERRVPKERVRTRREKRGLGKRGDGSGNCRCPLGCCWATRRLMPQARRAPKTGKGGWAMTDGGREMELVVGASLHDEVCGLA